MKEQHHIHFAWKKICAISLIAMVGVLAGLTLSTKKAQAQTCACGYVPSICNPTDCANTPASITAEHAACVTGIIGFPLPQYCTAGVTSIFQHILNEFNDHKDWLKDDLAPEIVEAMQSMAAQLSAVSMNQTLSIGMFFDAKETLDTNRMVQELQVQAHEDYQPSESFCTFGTAVRSIAHTEEASQAIKKMLNQRQMARHLGVISIGGSSADIDNEDKANRWAYFKDHFCDNQDNGWDSTKTNTGLSALGNCNGSESGITERRNRTNIDVEYTRGIENNRFMNISAHKWPNTTPSADELNVLGLGNNLFGHKILMRQLSAANVDDEDMAIKYLNLRSIAAKRSVAENSFNSIVAMKSLGSSRSPVDRETHKYLGKILQDLGIPEDEVIDFANYGDYHNFDIGYLGTMEILAKKIFQNPTFYANLYETPANVKRKSAALDAIELMLERSIYESQLRREMAMSVLLSSRIETYKRDRPGNKVWGN